MSKENKKGTKGKYVKEDIVKEVSKLRLKEGKSIAEILEILQTEYGYGKTQSYAYIKAAQEYVAEIYNQKHLKLIEDSIARLEERMSKIVNDKVWLEFQKELNKLRGLYEEKLTVQLEYKAKFG
jgi:transcription termination factor Rho